MFRAADSTFAGSSLGETAAWREMVTARLASKGSHPPRSCAQCGVGQLVGSNVLVNDRLIGKRYGASDPDGQLPCVPGLEALEVRGCVGATPGGEELEPSLRGGEHGEQLDVSRLPEYLYLGYRPYAVDDYGRLALLRLDA